MGRGQHLDLLLREGRVVIWGGQTLVPGVFAPSPGLVLTQTGGGDALLGVWADDRHWLRQTLLPDGRYDEARGERESAYRGRYWISGDHIDDLDDLSFWAYGEFRDGVLEHAGYRLTRQP